MSFRYLLLNNFQLDKNNKYQINKFIFSKNRNQQQFYIDSVSSLSLTLDPFMTNSSSAADDKSPAP